MIEKERQTKTYAIGLDVIKWATHYEFNNGNRIKISPQTKLLYEYRLNRYRYFSSIGNDYCETNESCSNRLGFSKKSVDEVYSKELKEIGLLKVTRLDSKLYKYDVLELGDLIGGEFVSDKLKHFSKRKFKEKITYEELKTLDYNKRIANKARSTKDKKLTVIPIEELTQLRRYISELENIHNDN